MGCTHIKKVHHSGIKITFVPIFYEMAKTLFRSNALFRREEQDSRQGFLKLKHWNTSILWPALSQNWEDLSILALQRYITLLNEVRHNDCHICRNIILQLASILTLSPSRIHTPDTCRRQLATTSQARSKVDVLGSLKGLGQAPAPPLALGLAGVIPFVAAPAYMINTGAFCPTLATYHLGWENSLVFIRVSYSQQWTTAS